MSGQAKFEKVLRLLVLLSGKRYYSISELAMRFDMSERTVRRYIKTFEAVGIVIDKRKDGLVRIERNSKHFKELHELLHFSKEESQLLNEAIYNLEGSEQIKSALTQKLHALYNFDRVALPILKKEEVPKIENLIQAYNTQQQVLIKNYQSNNSEQITDRLIEPFKFIRDYDYVIGYELASRQCKMFKTSRMKAVEVTEVPWEYQKEHQPYFVDIFRMASSKKIAVKLRLNQRAYNILLDGHPLAKNFIQALPDGNYLFDGWVCNYKGIEKFVLGLLGNVEIIQPDEFRDYLNKKIKNFQF